MSLLIPGTNSIKDTGFDVANSVRLDGDAYLHKTQSGGNRKTWTMSCWTKLTGAYGSNGGMLMAANGTNDATNFLFGIDNGGHSGSDTDTLSLHVYGADGFRTTPVLRDYSAWYHIVLAMDTTQATSTNRLKLYVNNVQQTLSEQSDYPAEDAEMGVNNSGTVLGVGNHPGSTSSYGLNSYMAEFVLIDGLQLAPTEFGEYDSDSPTIWKPKNVSGLTFGTNGFYLDFEDASNLGNDVNGGTDLTEVSLAATDQSLDTCTNNFCTMNLLDNKEAGSTFSEGNLKITTTNSAYTWNTSTFGLSSGKWYCEVKIDDPQNTDSIVGIANAPTTSSSNRLGEQSGNAYDWGYRGDGQIGNASSVVSYTISAMSNGDIIGIYLDLDNNKLYFSINGSLQNSGTGISITAPSSTTTGNYFFAGGDRQSGDDTILEWNFGGTQSFTVSSGNTDDNGYGNFEYSPNITGDGSAKSFYACNTKNLAEYGG